MSNSPSLHDMFHDTGMSVHESGMFHDMFHDMFMYRSLLRLVDMFHDMFVH